MTVIILTSTDPALRGGKETPERVSSDPSHPEESVVTDVRRPMCDIKRTDLRPRVLRRSRTDRSVCSRKLNTPKGGDGARWELM